MKTLRCSLLVASVALLGVASLASAAVPAMTVTVSNSAGKLMFKGKTNAAGLFSTKSLAPGSYVVQFNSDSSKGGPYALVIGAGKKKVVADSVPASKFSKGGVAMRVEVSKAMSLTGQVSDAAANTTASNGKVKYINGKKFVWIEGAMGSNLGGRWVDAASPEARDVILIDQKGIQEFQDRTQPAPPPNAK
ncbi:MAG: carboxypeptidase-like regulatory domain-containing protein [Bryobacteraceae bacterium]